MLNLRFLLFGVLVLKFSYEASAMECNGGLITFSCPLGSDSENMFCCKSPIPPIEVCCDAGDFLKENTGILAGILVGILVILIIITLCCCCFCSCCCLAKRRLNRGTVLYGPVTPGNHIAPASYQVVHPPPSEILNPPPFYQAANPTYTNYQPPANPDYKY